MRKINLFAIIFFVLLLSVVSAGKIDYKSEVYCHTHSMIPLLCYNTTKSQVIIVNTVDVNDSLTVGQIYLYRPDYRNFNLQAGQTIIHRLVKIEKGLYYFKGDNNKHIDPPVERKYINLKFKKVWR